MIILNDIGHDVYDGAMRLRRYENLNVQSNHQHHRHREMMTTYQSTPNARAMRSSPSGSSCSSCLKKGEPSTPRSKRLMAPSKKSYNQPATRDRLRQPVSASSIPGCMRRSASCSAIDFAGVRKKGLRPRLLRERRGPECVPSGLNRGWPHAEQVALSSLLHGKGRRHAGHVG